MKSEPGAPITLGAAAGVRLIVWRRDWQHRIEIPGSSPADTGPRPPVIEWKAPLVCSGCGGPKIDMVVTGTKR
jgi:hypothetical protein